MATERKTLMEIAQELEKTVKCNCDLDNWEPERTTNHSWVCTIHKLAVEKHRIQYQFG